MPIHHKPIIISKEQSSSCGPADCRDKSEWQLLSPRFEKHQRDAPPQKSLLNLLLPFSRPPCEIQLPAGTTLPLNHQRKPRPLRLLLLPGNSLVESGFLRRGGRLGAVWGHFHRSTSERQLSRATGSCEKCPVQLSSPSCSWIGSAILFSFVVI